MFRNFPLVISRAVNKEKHLLNKTKDQFMCCSDCETGGREISDNIFMGLETLLSCLLMLNMYLISAVSPWEVIYINICSLRKT